MIDLFSSFLSKMHNQRVRRQWDSSSIDKMNNIYRSFSTLDIDVQNPDKPSHKLTSLPPLRNNNSKNSATDRRAFSSQRDLTDSRSVRKQPQRNSFEWVVTRPRKRKPRDALTLEGVMDMKTTFSDTYDATAREVHKDMTSETSFEPVVTCTSSYKEFIPTLRPSRRRRKERPKTSLKVGGPGNYQTVNKESFRNFIVVTDDNNNDPAKSRSPDQNFETSNNADDGAGEKQQENKTAPADSKLAITKEVGSQHETNTGRDFPADHTAVDSNDEKKGTNQMDREPDSLIAMAKDDGRSMQSDSAQSLQENRAEDSLDDGETVTRQKRETESRSEIAVNDEMQMPRSQSGGLQEAGAGTRGRSAQKTESRSRHLSYPRTKHKHKNESQLRFDGAMDFETTTRRLYRNCEDKEDERNGSRKRISRTRDLFRPSDEIDLFHSHRNDKFDGQTTYSVCFQNKQYCPAVDLNTNHSEYLFREKTGSHKYYCSVNHLS